ncbi:MAG TPA: polymorphic toxin type 30 domain-containing protein [Micromonosporaceae bacterium]|nr:polymorphic toxin type 30 domain-containing protein [Micromonosporaceae bacterium]
MGIQEPSSPLWFAVKAIYDSWPPDDEVVAAQLGDGWRHGVEVMTRGGAALARSGGAVEAAWTDRAGSGFTATVGEYLQVTQQLQQQMHLAAARGDTYAQELVSAKSIITATIAANEARYALLGNPLFGALGSALRDVFATQIATFLRDMVMEKAAALAAGTAGAPPEPPPPPPPREGEDDGWSWRDIGHTALDVIGLIPVAGELADAGNALWYASEGDMLNAGLSAAAMVPIAGWVATGGKLGYRAVNDGLQLKPVDSLGSAWTWLKNRPWEVPLAASQKPFKPDAKYSTGLKYEWRTLELDPVDPRNPPTVENFTYHAHGRDPSPARKPGENSYEGPIYRIKVDGEYLDAVGGKHTVSSLQGNSAAANEAANATHMPFSSRYHPAPDQTYSRVFVPNAAALGPNGSTEGD